MAELTTWVAALILDHLLSLLAMYSWVAKALRGFLNQNCLSGITSLTSSDASATSVQIISKRFSRYISLS